ncbi:MAG: glycosyltransferase [Francisella endosymbiont of Hyalomma asiaticum]
MKEKYDVVHCHTPVPSVLTILAIKNIKQKPKLIYTAHCFHFYKEASLKNWLIFYPIEKYLSKNIQMF